MNENQLLALWAEAGRHAVLETTLPVFIHLLQDRLPLVEVSLYDAGLEPFGLDLIYRWRPQAKLESLHHSIDLSPALQKSLLAWLAAGEICVSESADATPECLAVLVQEQGEDSDYFAPLALSAGGHGLLFLRIRREVFSSAELALLDALIQPLTVMIDNDHRLREIQRLRAAAEADRDTLLTRLGRTSLSSEAIIGVDGGLRTVMQRVGQVAPTDASVLILGETGSGKEVIARAIHERSRRHGAPFIRVNCGALPSELIDTELFGHEKGSFTGAMAAHRGWFERADGGTLFLDEIGELPLAAQVRLLRVLQDGVLQRVGSENSIQVDVRVVAATHRDLPHMVKNGEFREDLWYRLAVFPIILPALRERLEDIEPLAQHCIERAAQRLGVPIPPLHKSDIDRLRDYDWPGNVRELGAVLERAVILGRGHHLDLHAALGVQLLRPGSHDNFPDTAINESAAIEPLDTVISAHLKRTLTRTRGRVDGAQGAASLLGLNPNTLRGKLRRYRIDPAKYRQR
ncbi:sigma-54 interaction domain-containing protein [Sedimenticola hydrogenitrophicus]|uniref:sigma-54 interaction domain-containing protein n=1 Tax=Sedimenticola hydrogenitrophicus TaxID=2967975 RepID=UPI0021A25C16|nr:sigma-54 dependent transcriptional regulator [Sedimenticola hydrogenitrophicus]